MMLNQDNKYVFYISSTAIEVKKILDEFLDVIKLVKLASVFETISLLVIC